MKYSNPNLFLVAFLTLTIGSICCSAMEKPSTVDNKGDHSTPMRSQVTTSTHENGDELDEENNEIQDPRIRRLGPQTLNRTIELALKLADASSRG